MKLLAASTIAPPSPGTLSFRIVMRFDEHNKSTPFVIHRESSPGEDSFMPSKGHGYHNGDYCETIAEALAAFERRSTPSQTF